MTEPCTWSLPQPIQSFTDKIDSFISDALDTCNGPLEKLGDTLSPRAEQIGLIAGLAAAAFAVYSSTVIALVGVGVGLLVGTEILPSLSKVVTNMTNLFNKVFGENGGKAAIALTGLAFALFLPSITTTYLLPCAAGVFGGYMAGIRAPIKHPEVAQAEPAVEQSEASA